MASEVSICNNALIQVGAEDTLISLDDDTKEGRLCKAMYETARDEVLTRFSWNSARRQAQLAALTETPIYGYAYAFQLPADCLRVIKIGVPESSARAYVDDGVYSYGSWEPVDWERQGRKVLSNVSPLYITYLAKITDPNEYDPALRDAIAAYLAAKIAYNLTGSRTKEETMKQWFREVIDEAMATNSLEGSTQALSSPQLVVTR